MITTSCCSLSQWRQGDAGLLGLEGRIAVPFAVINDDDGHRALFKCEYNQSPVPAWAPRCLACGGGGVICRGLWGRWLRHDIVSKRQTVQLFACHARDMAPVPGTVKQA